jgi:hypothetical protein
MLRREQVYQLEKDRKEGYEIQRDTEIPLLAQDLHK